MTEVLPNTPPLNAALLDRYEQLLDRAKRQHHDQMERARALLEQSTKVAAGTAAIRRDERAVETRLACLDAAATALGPFLAQLAEGVLDDMGSERDSDDDDGHHADRLAIAALCQEYWLIGAREAEKYVESGVVADPLVRAGAEDLVELLEVVNEACGILSAVTPDASEAVADRIRVFESTARNLMERLSVVTGRPADPDFP